jgi:hypothetical protein
MSELKSSTKNDDGLKALIDAKILNPNITLSNLLEVAKRLEGEDAGQAQAWQFIVKGKFIWKDDSAKIVSPADWTQG